MDSGAFRGLADLAGRRLALITPDLGSPNGIEAMAALSQGGLTVDDVDLTALAYPDMNLALANGSIDAALQTEPFVTLGVQQGFFVRLLGNDQLVPNHQNAVLVYSPGFAATDEGKRFMVAYVRGIRDYNRAFERNEGREAVVEILVRTATVTNPDLYYQMVMPGMNPNGYVDRDSLERDQAIMLSLNQIPSPLPMDQLVDNSFADHAVARLGRE